MQIIEQTQAPEMVAPQVNVFDTSVFEACFKISEVLASSTMIPETLTKVSGKDLPKDQVISNCMLVVEQAHRWGMSPFACIGCASVVRGKLQWEGKLVAAVLDAKLGVQLNYNYSGDGEGRAVVVSGTLPGEAEARKIDGTVAAWKTTGAGSPWNALTFDRQLAYRGAREWARRHAPAILLGVVTDDESLPVNVTGSAGGSRLREKVIEPFKAVEGVTIENIDKPVPQIGEAPEVKPEVKPVALVNDVEVTEAPEESDAKWTRYRVHLLIEGSEFTATTFSTRLGQVAQSLIGSEAHFVLIEEAGKGSRLTELEAVATQTEGSLL